MLSCSTAWVETEIFKKETYITNFHGHIFILSYYKNRFTCFNAVKTHPLSHCIPPLSEMLRFSSWLYKKVPFPITRSALIGQLTYSWASTANNNNNNNNNNRAANQFLRAQLAT